MVAVSSCRFHLRKQFWLSYQIYYYVCSLLLCAVFEISKLYFICQLLKGKFWIRMKLRQKIAFGLCIFYLVSVIGVALSLHFCGGKLSAVHFTRVVSCIGCKTDQKADEANKCCKNTAVDAKIKDSHQSGTKVELPRNFSIQLFLAPFLSEMVHAVLPKIFSKVENKAPPFSARVSLYAYNCVFRN